MEWKSEREKEKLALPRVQKQHQFSAVVTKGTSLWVPQPLSVALLGEVSVLLADHWPELLAPLYSEAPASWPVEAGLKQAAIVRFFSLWPCGLMGHAPYCLYVIGSSGENSELDT